MNEIIHYEKMLEEMLKEMLNPIGMSPDHEPLIRRRFEDVIIGDGLFHFWATMKEGVHYTVMIGDGTAIVQHMEPTHLPNLHSVSDSAVFDLADPHFAEKLKEFMYKE